MKMIILHLKEYVRHRHDGPRNEQINPVRNDGIRHHIDRYQRKSQLQYHIDAAYDHVRYLQFVRHQLEHMLAMRLSQILMQHDAMADGQHAVQAIQQIEYNPGDIPCLVHQPTKAEYHDERHAYRSNIPWEI